MYSIEAPEILACVSLARPDREVGLRSLEDGNLIQTLSIREVRLLAASRIGSGAKQRPYIGGMCNKNGLRWLYPIADISMIRKLLRRMIYQTGRTVSEACSTTQRESLAGGGVSYSHREDVHKAWERGDHWLFWGHPERQNRACLVVPR